MEHSNYSGHLHILEAEEIAHIYALPNFTPDERALFFALSTPEREQVSELRGVSSKVYFILQLGYFKAKHLFFTFDFEDGVLCTLRKKALVHKQCIYKTDAFHPLFRHINNPFLNCTS